MQKSLLESKTQKIEKLFIDFLNEKNYIDLKKLLEVLPETMQKSLLECKTKEIEELFILKKLRELLKKNRKKLEKLSFSRRRKSYKSQEATGSLTQKRTENSARKAFH